MLHAGISVTTATAARLIAEIARMTSSIVAVSRVHLVLRVGVVRWCVAVTTIVPVTPRTILAGRVSRAASSSTSFAACIIVGLELGAVATVVTLVVVSTSAARRSFVRLSLQLIEPSLLLLQDLLFCLELLAQWGQFGSLVVIENAAPDRSPGFFLRDRRRKVRDGDVEFITVVYGPGLYLRQVHVIEVQIDVLEAWDLDLHLLHSRSCRLFLGRRSVAFS